MGIKKHSLSDALFSKTKQSLLGLLFSQPDRAFYTNEIIRLANSGAGSVQRELEKLFETGLISLKQIGNQKHYQANRNMPLFSEIRSIVIKTFGLADILRNALNKIDANIHFAFIYGSIAKQEDIANSDIDLMLIGDDLTYSDLFKYFEKIEKQLGRPVNPTCYSLPEWIKKLKSGNNFLNKTIEQPKIFLIGAEDELKKIG